MTSTATEVRLKMAMYESRIAPVRAAMDEMFGSLLQRYVFLATRRRRKSKGYRKHVRRMKAEAR